MSVQRNTLYNLAGAALPLAVSLLTVPLYLHQVGEARFGILSIVWLLLGYFGLFDLGLGMATAQRIAASREDGRGTQARIFWTALVTNAALGVLGGVLAWPAATYYFGHSLKVGAALREEMIASVPWLVLAVPLATVTGVSIGALQGLHRFGRLNIISVVGAMLFQLVPLAAAMFWSPSLLVLLPISFATQAVTLAMLLTECWRSLLRGQAVGYDRAELKVLFRFGFWVTVSAFFTPFVVIIDRFILGAFVSAAAVALYSVPFNLGQRLCILGNSAGTALFPQISSVDRAEAHRLGEQSERAIAAVMLMVVVAAIFIVGPFLELWVGRDFGLRATAVAQILMVGVWLEAVSRIPLYVLRGQSRPQAVARIDLIQLIPFWIALYFLIVNLGIEGVAIAYVFRVLLNYLLLEHETRTIGRMMIVNLISGAVLLGSLVLARRVDFGWEWIVSATLCEAVAVAIAWQILPHDLLRRRFSWRRPLGTSA